MDSTSRFAALLERPEPQVRLDEAALLVAAHAYPDLDLGTELGRLDAIAERCYAPTLDALVVHLFADLGFHGNTDDYYDPRNSFLNDVIGRRTGIPITLSLLTIEVGRRIGVPVAGVSLPGHFLLRDRVDPEVFVDPFARGRMMDRAGCEEAFHRIHGPDAPFDPAYLDPVGPHLIVARLLANLKSIYLARRDRQALRWTLRLRSLVPGVPLAERRELASVLASEGQFSEAAEELELLAPQLSEQEATAVRSTARRYRARLN